MSHISEKANNPLNVPSPPMAIRASILFIVKVFKAFLRPSNSIKRLLRAVFRIVPPLCTNFCKSCDFNGIKSPSINPSYPLRNPLTFIPFFSEALAIAYNAAFIPGLSPPEVNTPMCFILVLFISSLFQA